MAMIRKPFIFRQFYEAASSTYTYLIGCQKTRDAIIIDPVLETVERDSKYVREMDLNLLYGINTHVHADHITGTGELKKVFPKMKSILSPYSGGKADIYINYDNPLKIGGLRFYFLSTPGHTNGCTTIVSDDLEACFTGDALLIRGCGRTDFQGGSSEKLYKSITEKIFKLPEHYNVYPGHDYNGVHNSTIREEKKYNPRLTKSLEEFVEIMKNLNLDKPHQIEKAVPLNLKDGITTFIVSEWCATS